MATGNYEAALKLAEELGLTPEQMHYLPGDLPGEVIPGVRHQNRTETITANELQRLEFPLAKWVVPGILPEGVTLLAGRPKIGKSWLALDFALAVAAGGFAMGKIPVDRAEVLYLALEDSRRRLQSRQEALLDGQPAPDSLHFATRWPTLDDGGLDALEAWLATHPNARLIVIDTLQRVRPRETSGSLYALDYRALEPLADIARERGTSILLSHHTRKLGADDFIDLISGTLGLAGAADTLLVLQRTRGKGDAQLHITGRDVDEAAIALNWDAPHWVLQEEGRKPTPEQQQIINLLEEEGPLSPKQVAAKTGRNVNTIKTALWRMGNLGILEASSGLYDLCNRGNRATGATGATVKPGCTVAPVAHSYEPERMSEDNWCRLDGELDGLDNEGWADLLEPK